jgi:choline dehydrogenase
LAATRARWAKQSGLSFLPNQDPNRFDNVGKEGLFLKPIAVRSGLRSTHYNYMKDTEANFPNFHISLNSLATKIIMKGNKAVGVNYMVGKSLYKADQQYNKTNVKNAKRKKAFAKKEVIVSGGSYNTPQLLMLSGIGPAKQLNAFDIPIRVRNKYIGTNLQDRYEVAINMEMKNVWKFFTTCTFTFDSSDPCYVKYLTDRGSASIYSSNAVIISSAHKSAYANSLTDAPPDLVVFEATAFFDGYKPNYPTLNAAFTPNNAVVLPLMAHTINNAGTVTLTSTDPTDMPDIRFRYFEEGSDTEGHDLAKSVEAVNFIRAKLNSDAAFLNYTVGERGPMANYTGANTATGIRNEAWGHHACCTAPIGTAIDSKFRVIGAKNLRVVDASVFPKIPGYFINVPVMMISEKATDVILGL